MDFLQEKIVKEGKVLQGGILKVTYNFCKSWVNVYTISLITAK